MLTRRQFLNAGSAAIIAGVAPRMAWGRTEADVVVIGAGLSGLYAASFLEAGGASVVVLEGQKRIGGRLCTLDDLPGHPEAGGTQVGQSYGRLRSVAARLDVRIDDHVSSGLLDRRGNLYRINGQTITEADWPGSSANLLAGEERSVLPAALGRYYEAKMPRLKSRDDWMTPESIKALDVPLLQALTTAGASPEAVRLVNANLNGNGVTTFSALQQARAAVILRSGPPGGVGSIAGGSQRLPEAMARDLKSAPRLGQVVTGIVEDESGVTVSLAGGRSVRARHVICTIPFAALREIPVVGRFGPALAASISSLSYTRVGFAYLEATEPFWKNDGHPDTLWTDEALLGRVFVESDDPPMLKTWVYGPNADYLERLPPAEAGAEIIRRIEAARPSSQGKLKVARILNWRANPMARGIYHHMSPGQGPMHAEEVRARGQRLHFAGEHMAQEHSGMEGALEAGGRVARDVMTRL